MRRRPPTNPAPSGISGSESARNGESGARARAIAERLTRMPKSSQAGYLRATRGEASPRAAIKSFCLECVCWDRGEVRRCTGGECPLWLYRPFRQGGV